MSNRASTGLVVLSLLMSGVVACASGGGSTDKDGSAGSGGSAAGTGGATAGSGGATAGTGGAMAGSGGATAGSGGSDAGVAGSDGGDTASDVGDAAFDAGDAASDAGDAGAGVVCVAITNAATPVTDVSMATVAVPAGSGGAIADGTYAMTGLTKYMGNTTPNILHSYTIKIAGTDLALSGHDGATADVNARFTMTTNATSGTFTTRGYCPQTFVGLNLVGWSSYTAAGGVLHIFSAANHTEHIFTKQ